MLRETTASNKFTFGTKRGLFLVRSSLLQAWRTQQVAIGYFFRCMRLKALLFGVITLKFISSKRWKLTNLAKKIGTSTLLDRLYQFMCAQYRPTKSPWCTFDSFGYRLSKCFSKNYQNSILSPISGFLYIQNCFAILGWV